MNDGEGFSVGEVARISGVTVRTLHHYDEIGLLVPSGRTSGGYRDYDSADVDRLMAIVAYRACGLALSDIAEVLEATGPVRAEHLRRQIAMIDGRLAALARQRSTLSSALEAHQMGITLDPEEYFEVFGESDPRQYADEVRELWGETDAYSESMRRTSAYAKDDWLRAQAEGAAVLEAFADCLAAGLAPDDARAMAAAEAHRENISTWYYPCSHEMQVGLAAYVHAAIYANALAR
ncbi:MAG: MerR family transcriptional regulator [Actinomycetota bacterium]|nr:MerR family transcriptional regulator [Actinomycetota bacterium]